MAYEPATGAGRTGEGGIEVRWYDTHGERRHTKLLAFHTTGGTTLLGGSTNLTRRNFGDYNLEADLLVRASDLSSSGVLRNELILAAGSGLARRLTAAGLTRVGGPR